MTRLAFSSLSIAALALGVLTAGCSSAPQDSERSATGTAALQTALGASTDPQPEILKKCPPGQELTCDPTENGRGVVCDCAFPPS